ncbi:MAG: hypothetical protein ABI002_11240 [Saprospiraceae bacterium]
MDCCALLAAIEKHCGTNAGYVKPSLKVICGDDVETIPAATAGVVTTALTLADTKTFFEWAVAQKGTLVVESSISDDGSTVEYTSTITVFVPKATGAKSDLLSNAAGDGKFVIVTDKNGVNWMLGEAENGCTVKPGMVANEKNGYPITITWTSNRLPYAYTGPIVL